MSIGADFTFVYSPERRERFRLGELSEEWVERYPELFDEDDVRILKTEHQRQYHFFEWLSAVLLFESTGYISLMEKYTAKSHPLKLQTFSRLVSPDLYEFVMGSQSGMPDLFVFHPVTNDWFFAEVKGGADKLRKNQLEMIAQLKERTSKHVRIIQLNEIRP